MAEYVWIDAAGETRSKSRVSKLSELARFLFHAFLGSLGSVGLSGWRRSSSSNARLSVTGGQPQGAGTVMHRRRTGLEGAVAQCSLGLIWVLRWQGSGVATSPLCRASPCLVLPCLPPCPAKDQNRNAPLARTRQTTQPRKERERLLVQHVIKNANMTCAVLDLEGEGLQSRRPSRLELRWFLYRASPRRQLRCLSAPRCRLP